MTKRKPQTEERDESRALPLPEVIHTEKSLVGAIMISPKLLFNVIDDLQPQHFIDPLCREAYVAIRALADENREISIVSVVEYLKKHDKLGANGIENLAALSDYALVGSGKHEAQQIVECRTRRTLLSELQRSQYQVLDRTISLDSCIGEIESKLLTISSNAVQSKPERIDDGALKVVLSLHEQRLTKRRILGASFGFQSIDSPTTGARDGEYCIIAARPGAGKTAFVCGMALELAEFDGEQYDVAFFSLEMRRDELIARMLARQSGVNHLQLRDPRSLNDEQLERLAEEAERLKRFPIWIDDKGSMHIDELIARARKLKHEATARGKKLLMILDYVQLVHGNGLTDLERINDVSTKLREFFKSQLVAGIVLSQLTKADKKDVSREPNISELKGTGNLEQDAHLAMLLHVDVNADGEKTTLDWIRIAKNRNGPTGKLLFEFRGATLSWHERQPKEKEAKPKVETPKAEPAKQQELLAKDAAAGDADDDF